MNHEPRHLHVVPDSESPKAAADAPAPPSPEELARQKQLELLKRTAEVLQNGKPVRESTLIDGLATDYYWLPEVQVAGFQGFARLCITQEHTVGGTHPARQQHPTKGYLPRYFALHMYDVDHNALWHYRFQEDSEHLLVRHSGELVRDVEPDSMPTDWQLIEQALATYESGPATTD